MTTLFTILIAIIIALLCIAWGLAIVIRKLEKQIEQYKAVYIVEQIRTENTLMDVYEKVKKEKLR